VVGRRTVVRGAVVTAWSVPLVQAVAATPALAGTVKSGPASLRHPTGTATLGSQAADGTYPLKIDVTVTNGGGSATKNLNATLNLNPKNGITIKGSTTTGNWSGSASGTTASWSPNTQLGANGSSTLSATLTLSGDPGHPTKLTLTFMADGTNTTFQTNL
jgi:hypothetical protein